MTLLLCVGIAVLSVAGYLGKDTIYQNYTKDLWETPYFSLVLAGLHDGVMPWDELPEEEKPVSASMGNVMVQAGQEENLPEAVSEHTTAQTDVEGVISDAAPPALQEEPVERTFVDVDVSYFDDALFIGDSRTVGLRDYGGLDNATFYATIGLNIYDLWTEVFCKVDDKNCTLEEALSEQQFGKIYIQIGINEMGRGTLDGFIREYEEAVMRIRDLQPDAILYVQGIMCVAKEKSDTDEIYNNQAIRERNGRIAELADNRTIFYIDMNEVVCDEQGNLKEELTFDNLHLYGNQYGIWVDFLLTKGVE